MKLYYSRNYNPRLAVAVSRYLKAPVDYEFAEPFKPGNEAKFLKLNPNQSIPILLEGEKVWWEADAISCRLAQIMQPDFWPTDERLPELARWLSWGYWNFIRACDVVHWERVTKQRYGIGPVQDDLVTEGLQNFARHAKILNAELGKRDWLVGQAVTYADFRVACVLPYADLAGLPLADFPHVEKWHNRLLELPAWRDPFEGLNTPELPTVTSTQGS
jgi:glutathione S-transferase